MVIRDAPGAQPFGRAAWSAVFSRRFGLIVFAEESTTSPFWFVHRALSASVSGEPTVPTEPYTLSAGANWNVGPATRFPSPMRLPIITCVTLSVFEVSAAFTESAAAAAVAAAALSACCARELPPWQETNTI